MEVKALLWDCDGCLIDSERIACEFEADVFTRAGYPLTTQDYITRFAGQGKRHVFDTVLRESGIDLNTAINADERHARQWEMFRQNLKAVAHIHETVRSIPLPQAVASGSDTDRLNYTLQLTELYDFFAPHVYSSVLVGKGKPEPDIFYYAADQLQVPHEGCLIVEDSENGIRAGVAAKAHGMRVFGFVGGEHIADKAAYRERLLSLGAELVFDDMRQLPKLAGLTL